MTTRATAWSSTARYSGDAARSSGVARDCLTGGHDRLTPVCTRLRTEVVLRWPACLSCPGHLMLRRRDPASMAIATEFRRVSRHREACCVQGSLLVQLLGLLERASQPVTCAEK